MSKTASSSWLWVGNATHWPSIRATRTAPTGPENGRPEIWVESDAALIASTSYGVLGSSAITVMTTWTSLRRPFLKVGRSGRSIRRQVRIASSPGPALGPEERAGDLARGVHPLLDVDRQGEEVEVVLGVLAGRGGRQQHGVVVEVGGHRTGGLPGEEPGLELHRALPELAVVEDSLDGRDHGLVGRGFSQGSFPVLFTEPPPSRYQVRPVFDRGPRCACERKPLPRTEPERGGRLLGVLLGFSCSVVRAEPIGVGSKCRRSGCPEGQPLRPAERVVSDADRGARRWSGSERSRSSAGS